MEDLHKARKIFEEWKTDFNLKSMSEKKRERVQDNFIDLFATMNHNKIDAATAGEYIMSAAKVHFPDDDIAKMVYKRILGRKAPLSKFVEGWKREIKEAAQNVFYQVYPKLEDNSLEEEKQRIRDQLQAKKIEATFEDAIDYEDKDREIKDEAWVEHLLSFTKPLTAEEYQSMVDQRERILSEGTLND